jgi:hypothetical protein
VQPQIALSEDHPPNDWRHIGITFIFRLLTDGPDATRIESSRNLSEIAFHEKAGRSQVDSVVFSLDKVFSSPSRRCRHFSIRTLRGAVLIRSVQVGRSRLQPVLPPDWRPLFRLTMGVGQAINAVTGTRL